jgi:sugar O-acyltransferase (sialic acid O-acetyltransferase NeuD family)
MILGIYGAGGLGREIYEVAVRRNSVSSLWRNIIFIDDFSDECDFYGTKKIKFNTLMSLKDECECLVAVGEPAAREFLFKKLQDNNLRIATLIDPSAIVSPTADVKTGSIICEYSTIHTEVSLGFNTLIQPFCNIGHDIKVGNHSILSSYCAPGGQTFFGDRVFVGLSSTFKESLKIGSDVIVGMGSVVFRDIPAGATVVGNPARITKGNDEHKVFI